MTRAVTALPPATVHVWQATLEIDPASVAHALPLLSQEERHRAGAYRSITAAERFVVGRSWLRNLLSTYTGVPPADLSIRAPRHEKPVLLDPPHDVRFNLTHAGDQIACAVAAGFEVGIDIEAPRPGAVDALAATILSASEEAQLAGLPGALRNDAVMRQWTRKEAVLKGLGTGLRLPPAHLELGLDPSTPLAGAVTAAAGTPWSLWDLYSTGSAFGAVAAAATHVVLETSVAQMA